MRLDEARTRSPTPTLLPACPAASSARPTDLPVGAPTLEQLAAALKAGTGVQVTETDWARSLSAFHAKRAGITEDVLEHAFDAAPARSRTTGPPSRSTTG